MNRKHIFPILLLALLALGACGKAALPAPAPQQTVPQTTPGIVTDSGQAETVEDYFDRTAIIARNERLESASMLGFDTDVWALEYAALNYKECTARAEFDSGYSAPDGLFSDSSLSGGVVLWRLILTQPDGTSSEERVQTFFFAENGTICLSGLLAGQNILADREAGYAYLALDPRFAQRMQAVPTPDEPEETVAVELSRLCGGENRQDAYPLSETRAALVQAEKRVVLYDFVSAAPVQESELGAGWQVEHFDAGLLTLTLRDETGMTVLRRMTVTPEGIAATNVDGQEEESYPVGADRITERDGSLCLGDEVLLEGGGTFEDAVGYRFRFALDDHRFSYDCWGYEWLEHSGIYDLSSRTDLPLGGTLSGAYLLGVSEDGNTALTCKMEDLGYCYDYALLDLPTGERRPLALAPNTLEEGADIYPAVNPSLSRLCLWGEDDSGCTVTVYDTATEKVLFSWTVSHDAASVSGVTLTGDGTLYVSMHRYSTGGEWLYRIEY